MGKFQTVYRSIFILFIFLIIVIACFGVMYLILDNKAVLKNTQTKVKYDLNSAFMSSFGSKEYKCYGTCSCSVEDDTTRRFAIAGARSLKHVVSGLFAITAFWALKDAGSKFVDDCKDLLENECDESFVLSEVDDCVESKESEQVNDETMEEDDKGVCSVNDAIFGRQSIRDFSGKKIPKETIEEIIVAGNRAPSAMNQQPLRYYVIDNQELLQDISDVCLKIRGNRPLPRPMKSIFYNSPVVIFITWKNGGVGYEKLDAGLAMQNMQLHAYSKDIGSCCIGNVRYGESYIAKVLGFEAGEKLMCALIFGYNNPDVEVPRKKRKEAVVDWSNSEYEDEV